MGHSSHRETGYVVAVISGRNHDAYTRLMAVEVRSGGFWRYLEGRPNRTPQRTGYGS